MKEKIMNYVLYSSTVILLVVGMVALFLWVKPVNVIQNWTLTLPSKNYTTDQVISVHSSLDKKLPLVAVAHHNIECIRPNGSVGTYHIGDFQGISSQTGHMQSEIEFNIPATLPDLPTTCWFSITSEYRVYGFRTVIEYVRSNSFTVTQSQSIN